MPVPATPAAEAAPSLMHSLLRGFAGVGATRLAQMAMSLLVSVLLARTLGPENFGSYTFVLALVGLCALPAYAGLAPLLVREVARYDARLDSSHRWPLIAELWSWASRVTLLVACFTGLVCGLILALRFFSQTAVEQMPILQTPGGNAELEPVLIILLALSVVLVALTRIGAALLQGLRRVVVATLPETVVRPTVLLLLLVVLWSAGALDTSNALLCFAAASFCAFIFSWFLLRGARAGLRSHRTAESLDQGPETARWRNALVPFTGIAAAGYLNTELFVPLVGLFADAAEVAYFKIALSLALLVGMPLTLVESVIKPQVTRLYEASDGMRLQRLVSRSGWGALGLSLPVLVLFGVFGERVVEVAFGAAYTAATLPMLILAAGFAVVNLVGPSMQLLYATQYEKDALVISLLSLVGVILLSIAMIPVYGAVGAATAFAIAKVFRAVAFRFWASRRLHTLFNAGSQ